MKLFSYPAGAKVGGQELSERTVLPAQAFEVGDVQYGVEVLSLWTTGMLAAIGAKPVVEDPVEVDHEPGEPADVDEGVIVYRTYPNATFSQNLHDARLAGIAEKKRAAYQAEADPLFFKWQRGEATKEAWEAKVAEIKARYA